MGLYEGQNLHELIQGAESAGKNDHRFSQVYEPEFPDKEIMEFEIQLIGDESIGFLLLRDADVQSDGFPPGFTGASIGGLHHPRAAAGTDDEPPV